MTNSRRGLSLVQKGLFLLLLPLVAQIILIANLSMMLRRTELHVAAGPPAEELARKSKRRADLSVITGALGLSVLSFALTALFILAIARRLTILNDDMKRFSDGREINRQIVGTDELADLERCLYDMATSLREAEKREEETDRLKQEFVAMVTHDLRTPLTSIKLFHQLLASGKFGELPESVQEPLESAERSINRLLSLVNGLLDFERLEAGKLKLKLAPTKLSTILSRSVESVQALADSQMITIVVSPLDLELVVDEDRLVQVMVNLFSNAIKFSAAGTHVGVDAALNHSDNVVEISVLDQGCGISPDDQSRIFDRFKQVETSNERDHVGTGLGLPICKGLIEQHGGTIGVDSAVGKGSRFWVRLPVRVPPSQNATPTKPVVESDTVIAHRRWFGKPEQN